MQKEMKKVVIWAIILGLLASGGWWYSWREKTRARDLMKETVAEIQLKDDLTVDVATEVKLGDFFAEFTGRELTEQMVETSTLGEQKVTFAYRDRKNRPRHASFLIEVVDRVAPTALYSKYTMLVGENDDLIAEIPCGDNVDPYPICVLEGEYDPDEAGVYDLTIVTKDASGNVGREPLTLQILEEYEPSETPPLTLEEMRAQKPGAQMGVDVSRWQEEIDWSAVKASGIDLAMIRIGSQTKFEGEPTLDKYFRQNWRGAKAAGLQVGVYFYSLAQTPEEAQTQAQWVLETLQGEKLDLPVVFDWEAWTYWNKLSLSYLSVNRLAEEFLGLITQAGYQGMLYGSKLPLKKIWWNRGKYPVWLAHYVPETDYDGDYQLWQFSATGEVEGIKGDVDLNVWEEKSGL